MSIVDGQCPAPSYSVPTDSASIATVNYVDVGYQELDVAKYVKVFREDLMNTATDLWRKGEVRRIPSSRRDYADVHDSWPRPYTL